MLYKLMSSYDDEKALAKKEKTKKSEIMGLSL